MAILDRVRALFGKLNRKTTPAGTIEREFGVHPAVSQTMENNQGLWYAMYVNHPPWETCDVRSLDFPKRIGNELAQHAMAEFSISVNGGARASYLNEQIQSTADGFVSALEGGLCLGGVAFKPYPENGRILVDVCTTNFTPTRFDGTGRAIGGVFRSAPLRQGRDWFVKLEYHDTLPREDGSSVYVIRSKAFRSGQDGAIGAEVPLSSVNAWADIDPEEWTIEDLQGPLFSYFKPPQSNNVDTDSPLGISVYAGPTAELIQQADEQWERLMWTFQVAEPKIFADGTLGDTQLKDRVFVHGAFTSGGSLFQVFDPEVKDTAYYRGFQYILQRIEYNVGLAFGTISDPQSVEKTATEILAAKQRQFVTEAAIQKSFQAALDGLLTAMDAWCDLADLAPKGDWEADYQWGDSILDDPETRRQDMAMGLQLMSAGVMDPLEFRMKYFGEDEATARSMLPGAEDLVDEE